MTQSKRPYKAALVHQYRLTILEYIKQRAVTDLGSEIMSCGSRGFSFVFAMSILASYALLAT